MSPWQEPWPLPFCASDPPPLAPTISHQRWQGPAHLVRHSVYLSGIVACAVKHCQNAQFEIFKLAVYACQIAGATH